MKQWYESNYKMLGAQWLIDSLEEVFAKKDSIVFLSPSANLGKYELDAFHELSKQRRYQKRLCFILGDLCGKYLYENNETICLNSNYLQYEKTGKDAKAWEYDGCVDVILDHKGALWYSGDQWTRRAQRQSVIELLEVYASYLKEDGVLLFDAYRSGHSHIYYFAINLMLRMKFKIGRLLELNTFIEMSTWERLERSFHGTIVLSDYLTYLPETPIRSGEERMRLASMSKQAIMRLLADMHQECNAKTIALKSGKVERIE